METLINSMEDAVSVLASAAAVGVTLGGMDPEAAAIMAAEQAVKNASDARTRNGMWASETSGAQIEDALFIGGVAKDVLDGTIERPSIGNSRKALIAAIEKRSKEARA